MKRVSIAVASALLSTVSMAANITVEQATATEKVNALVISGEIVQGDYNKFKNVVGKISNDKPVLVFLDGPGGSLIEAMNIGLAISKLKYSTIAYKGICASACAYIWLAGERAIVDMDSNAKVGFHSPYYTDKFGNKKSDNSASAMLGGYLKELGATYSIISYATSVDGDSILWLTESKAKEIGLSAEFYKTPPTNPVAKQQPTKIFNYNGAELTVTVNGQNQPHGTGSMRFTNSGDVESATYVNGIRQGPAIYTFTNGDQIFYSYVDGRRHGEARKYLASSGFQEVYNYVNGVLKGQNWTRFNKEGQIIASGVFN